MRLLINNRHSSHSYSLRHFSVLVDILCQPIAADICCITVAPHRVALLPDFSFGTDLNAIKQVLLLALSRLGDPFLGSQRQLTTLILASLTLPAHPQEAAAMQRLGYTADVRLFKPLPARVLRGALSKEAKKRDYTRLTRFLQNSRQSEIAVCHARWYQCSCFAFFIEHSISKARSKPTQPFG